MAWCDFLCCASDFDFLLHALLIGVVKGCVCHLSLLRVRLDLLSSYAGITCCSAGCYQTKMGRKKKRARATRQIFCRDSFCCWSSTAEQSDVTIFQKSRDVSDEIAANENLLTATGLAITPARIKCQQLPDWEAAFVMKNSSDPLVPMRCIGRHDKSWLCVRSSDRFDVLSTPTSWTET